jgi:hypothetical protein
MAEVLTSPVLDIVEPNIHHLITEDDEPVDNLPSATNQRLLIDPLYSTSKLKRPFLANANVGIFRSLHLPPIVPDMFLSLDVELAEDWWAKEHRSYYLWEFGKPPEVVVEIVSNKEGGEMGKKLRDYAQLHVDYYVVYDPQLLIQNKQLQVYELVVGEYLPRPDHRLPRIGLSLTIWWGTFEGKDAQWLRWCDLDGNLILTGAEQAEQERQRAEQERQRAEREQQRAEQEQQQAEQERQRAEQEQQRAEQERQRAERLVAKFRELGIDPDTI